MNYNIQSCLLLFGVQKCTELVIYNLFPPVLLAVTLSTVCICIFGFSVRVISAIVDSTLWHGQNPSRCEYTGNSAHCCIPQKALILSPQGRQWNHEYSLRRLDAEPQQKL